jgi:hypothetical protein
MVKVRRNVKNLDALNLKSVFANDRNLKKNSCKRSLTFDFRHWGDPKMTWNDETRIGACPLKPKLKGTNLIKLFTAVTYKFLI